MDTSYFFNETKNTIKLTSMRNTGENFEFFKSLCNRELLITQFTNLGTEKNLRGSKNSRLRLNCKKRYRENVFDFILVEAVKSHIV